jgi:hypothetical protein
MGIYAVFTLEAYQGAGAGGLLNRSAGKTSAGVR